MIKALFLDFYGTLVHESGPIAIEVIQTICRTGRSSSAKEVLAYWQTTFKMLQEQANGESFRRQHDVALDTFRDLLAHFESDADPKKLLDRMEEHWRTTALYEDALSFLEAAGMPVYFISNSDDDYIFPAVRLHGLHPEGIFTSEQARYCKPRKEIFQYALKSAGFTADEVVFIGDSLVGDVYGPALAGIRSIWINREGKTVPEGVVSAKGLLEALEQLEKM